MKNNPPWHVNFFKATMLGIPMIFSFFFLNDPPPPELSPFPLPAPLPIKPAPTFVPPGATPAATAVTYALTVATSIRTSASGARIYGRAIRPPRVRRRTTSGRIVVACVAIAATAAPIDAISIRIVGIFDRTDGIRRSGIRLKLHNRTNGGAQLPRPYIFSIALSFLPRPAPRRASRGGYSVRRLSSPLPPSNHAAATPQ